MKKLSEEEKTAHEQINKQNNESNNRVKTSPPLTILVLTTV